MAQISEITIEDLLKTGRCDAEFFRADYLDLEKNLQSFPHTWFHNIAHVTDGDHGSPNFDDSTNIIYLSAKTVKNNYFKLDEAETISKEQHERNKRSSLKEGDIILSTVGTIGNVAVVQEEMLPGNMDRHVGLIRLNEKSDLQPYFYSTFLDSKYGRFQSMRHATGNVQLNLYISKMNEFIVPEWNEEMKQIAEHTKNAYELSKQSKSLYAQAEKLLLEELGLETFVPQWVAGYETDHNNVLEVARMDAEYFQPKYKIIEEKVKEYKNGWDYLPKLIEVSKEKIQIELEKEYQYVELADINASIGIVDSTSKIFGADLPSRAQMKLQKDDVVVSSVEGSIDKVGLILSDDKNLVGSTGFHIFRSKAFTPEVNLILCKSPVLQYLFIREASGTILTAISSNSLAHIVVPKLDKAVQKKITELVQESHKCVLESRQLLEQAKREVEEMIEQ